MKGWMRRYVDRMCCKLFSPRAAIVREKNRRQWRVAVDISWTPCGQCCDPWVLYHPVTTLFVVRSSQVSSGQIRLVQVEMYHIISYHIISYHIKDGV